MVQFLSINLFLGFLQFLLCFSKVPVFLCHSLFIGLNIKQVSPGTVQICVAERRGYVLINASLGDFVVVRTRTYTNLEIIAYYTSRLYGIAYCS